MTQEKHLLTSDDIYVLSILGCLYRFFAVFVAFVLLYFSWIGVLGIVPVYLTTILVISLIYAVSSFILLRRFNRFQEPERNRWLCAYARGVTLIDILLLSAVCLYLGCFSSKLSIFFVPVVLYIPFVFDKGKYKNLLLLYIILLLSLTGVLESRGMLGGANIIRDFIEAHYGEVVNLFFIPGVIFYILLFTLIIETLRKRMEKNFDSLYREKERFQELEKFLEDVLSFLPVGVVIWEGENIRFYNRRIMDIFESDTLEKLLQRFRETGLYDLIVNVRPEEDLVLSDYPLLVNDKKKYLEIHVTMLNENVKIVSFKDVTRAKIQEEKAREAEAAMLRQDKLATIGQMVAGIAHELNNPITGISTYAQLLLHKFSRGREITEADLDKLQKIIADTERVSRLFENLLHFSRPSRKKEKLNVNRIVKEVLSLFEYQFRKNGIELKLNLTEPLPPVEFDRTELEEIIVNLIQNALQFLDKEEKWILIETSLHEGNEIEIAIEDNGIGIPPEEIDRIFTPFYTTREKGTGLGLSIVSNILEKNNGKIMVTSKPGKGSRFMVRIPVAEDL